VHHHPKCHKEISATKNGLVWFMVFNATFNNILVILWPSVLLVEETAVPGKKHIPLQNCFSGYKTELYIAKYSSPKIAESDDKHN